MERETEKLGFLSLFFCIVQFHLRLRSDLHVDPSQRLGPWSAAFVHGHASSSFILSGSAPLRGDNLLLVQRIPLSLRESLLRLTSQLMADEVRVASAKAQIYSKRLEYLNTCTPRARQWSTRKIASSLRSPRVYATPICTWRARSPRPLFWFGIISQRLRGILAYTAVQGPR